MNTKRILALLLSAVMLFGFAACNGAGSNVVVTYNTPQNWVNWGNVLTQFTKDTGTTAPNDNKNSGQSLTALIAEKDAPVCDVVYLGITFGMQAVEKGLLEPYKPEGFDKMADSLKNADGLYSTVHFGSIAICTNTEALGNLPVPQSWDDLLDPMYKGKIGFLDPTSAAVGYSVCVAINEAMGGNLDNFDPLFEYVKKLSANEVVYPKQTSTAKLMKGEIPILVDADFNGYGLKYEQNGPIEIVIPKEGSLKIPYVIGLVKNGPHPKEAKKLIDYLYSEKGQQLFARGYVRPINSDALSDDMKVKFLPDSDYERAIEVDWQKMADVQSDFNARWIKEVSVSK